MHEATEGLGKICEASGMLHVQQNGDSNRKRLCRSHIINTVVGSLLSSKGLCAAQPWVAAGPQNLHSKKGKSRLQGLA